MSVELERDNTTSVGVVFSTRVPCRQCGGSYALPKGTSSAPSLIGPCCQPMLWAATPYLIAPAGVVALPDLELELEPARELGWLGLVDVLCEGCRVAPADGRLTPGAALCLRCAEEAVEHWLAWLVDPSHDWWPSDDPFGSARHPVAGWRESER